jgi:hypothetical protein
MSSGERKQLGPRILIPQQLSFSAFAVPPAPYKVYAIPPQNFLKSRDPEAQLDHTFKDGFASKK